MKLNYIKFFVFAMSLGMFFVACDDDDDDCTELVYYQDIDGDGEGNRKLFVTSCNPLQGFVLNGLDPVDTDASITSANVWRGAEITFTKADYADWTLPENQDNITPSVSITKADNRGLFNAETETDFNWNVSPEGTLWAQGTLDDFDYLEFDDWRDAMESNPINLPGQTFVMYIQAEKVFVEVEFLSWTSNNAGGGFSYSRTTQ